MASQSPRGHFHGVPAHQSPRYQYGVVVPDMDGAASTSTSVPPSTDNLRSPGPSNWRSSALRTANLFEDQDASTEDGKSESHAWNSSIDEDQHRHTSASTPSTSTTRQSMTRVAKACVPCSTKKRRCDGGKLICSVDCSHF